jgi:hypothetical protein
MQVQDCDVHDGDAEVSSTLLLAPVISRAYSFLFIPAATGYRMINFDQFAEL